ncbi:YlbF family regulator [Paenibacillus sp. N1-5-1-14]|uniref:YlbF family regulator n=1 Tax=Paenibacillus radicibacter TaxID=2972488 RepID=UPI002158F5A9|nr:YlbF family regulator [Paenibacillus radicibacter]MCR8641735.1 YlbF family regulator [Paenibacillus radicibacter]
MSMIEDNALDMSAILMQAYDVGDMIKGSAELADYLYWKQAVSNDPEVQELTKLFAKKKEMFEECERFGHFHPSYHDALEQVQKVQELLDQQEVIRRYKEGEERLDDLLYSVSELIAQSVSNSIKVPSNKTQPVSGCASGGACSGKCS